MNGTRTTARASRYRARVAVSRRVNAVRRCHRRWTEAISRVNS
ncbi:hypothetical protein C7S14_8120 [Burkholderia cepacia]|nr:hypothetical protein C7S14_8120 [Burkholderia cepacia]